VIHKGYKARSGGLGTVIAIVNAHPIEIAQARSSTTNRIRLDVQSFLIHCSILDTLSIKVSCLQW
jgi:hypothetical protein